MWQCAHDNFQDYKQRESELEERLKISQFNLLNNRRRNDLLRVTGGYEANDLLNLKMLTH